MGTNCTVVVKYINIATLSSAYIITVHKWNTTMTQLSIQTYTMQFVRKETVTKAACFFLQTGLIQSKTRSVGRD